MRLALTAFGLMASTFDEVEVASIFTTLLMSTGLTFGTISSLYGLNTGIINKTQFSLLITVVVRSAIIPTAIAQRFFQPELV